jgi:hypothetical protein
MININTRSRFVVVFISDTSLYFMHIVVCVRYVSTIDTTSQCQYSSRDYILSKDNYRWIVHSRTTRMCICLSFSGIPLPTPHGVYFYVRVPKPHTTVTNPEKHPKRLARQRYDSGRTSVRSFAVIRITAKIVAINSMFIPEINS